MNIGWIAQKPSPYDFDLPGDNISGATNGEDVDAGMLRPRIMYRYGELLGVSKDEAVWRFGFIKGSEAAHAYGVALLDGNDGNISFVWVRTKRRSGKVLEVVRDWALNLPESFRKVIEAPVIMECEEGHIVRPTFHTPSTNQVVHN